jgi:hypothetical protein
MIMDKHFADRQKPWRLGKVFHSILSCVSLPALPGSIPRSCASEYAERVEETLAGSIGRVSVYRMLEAGQ